MRSSEDILVHLIRIALGAEKPDVIPEEVNWKEVFDLSYAQGVAAIACDGFQALYEGRGEDDIVTALDLEENEMIKYDWYATQIRNEQQYEMQWVAATELSGLFSKNGIDTISLKGFSIARHYPIPAHRYSCDFDCFLLPSDNDERFDAHDLGDALVERMGISVNRDFYKNSTFYYHNLMVENHRFCTPVRGDRRMKRFEQCLQRYLMSGYQKIDDSGLSVPDSLFLLLFVTEHAYAHFLHEGLQLKHFLDWIVLKKDFAADVDWAAYHEICDRFGFRLFADSFDAVSSFVIGEKLELEMNEQERMLLHDVFNPCASFASGDGLRFRVELVKNTLNGAWKYKYFTTSSMPAALLKQVFGFLFERHPEIDKNN